MPYAPGDFLRGMDPPPRGWAADAAAERAKVAPVWGAVHAAVVAHGGGGTRASLENRGGLLGLASRLLADRTRCKRKRGRTFMCAGAQASPT